MDASSPSYGMQPANRLSLLSGRNKPQPLMLRQVSMPNERIDRIDISDQAFAAALDRSARQEQLAEIRQQIAAGTYDEASKLDGAIDGLMRDLLGE